MVICLFVHLGEDFMVATDSIIGIFDLDSSTISDVTRKFLVQAEHDGTLVTISDDLPKSFIVTMQEGIRITYLSPISSMVIKRRVKAVDFRVFFGGNYFG